MKKQIMNLSECGEDVTERVVISHEEFYHENPRNDWDHVFTMWGNHSSYDFSDKGAECPFEDILDEDGYETGEQRVKKDTIVFSVNLYDHSGLSFSLGGDHAHGFDPGGWDTTTGAAYLYVAKEAWEKCGFAEPFGSEEMRKRAREIANCEVNEVNLVERGCWYGYRHEKWVPWTKTYADGRTIEGGDWETVYCRGGFLTDDPAKDVDFPRGYPVFTDCDWLVGDEYEDAFAKEVA